jgi:hypothetical protein
MNVHHLIGCIATLGTLSLPIIGICWAAARSARTEESQ